MINVNVNDINYSCENFFEAIQILREKHWEFNPPGLHFVLRVEKTKLHATVFYTAEPYDCLGRECQDISELPSNPNKR